MSKTHEKKLIRETLDRVGKNWSKASSTNRKLISRLRDIARYMSRSQGLNSITNMKTKHVDAYMQHLREDRHLAPSSLQGYATALRQLAAAIGKNNIVRSNTDLGANRPNSDRFKNAATPSDMERLAAIKESLYEKATWQGLAFDMQQQFGLRIKESLCSVNTIEQNGRQYLHVPRTGAKNGLERYVEVVTPQQRQLLERVNAYRQETGSVSLIPAEKSLEQAYWKQVHAISNLGGTKANNATSHCLRREYIRERYADIKQLADKNERDEQKQSLIEEVGHFDDHKLGHYTKL